MDHNHNNTAGMNSVNGSMEDLSLRQKQLPYRQQASKPLLKYSNSEPGPIYLYQNPDLQPSPPGGSQALPTAINSAPNSPAKVLPSKIKTISSTLSNNQQSTNKQFTATPFNYVPSGDPYARPLSAKDLMTIGIERTKSLNHLMNSTLAGSLANSMHATNMSNSSMFKPNKAETQQKLSNDVVPVTSAQNLAAPSTITATPSNTATTRVVSIQPSTVTQSAKEKFEASLSKPPTGLERGTRPPSALRRPLSSTVRNPNYTPTKPYNEISSKEEEDFKMVSDSKPRVETKSKRSNEDTLNNKITKAISTLSVRTKSTSDKQRQQLRQLSSSNESLSDPQPVSNRPLSAMVRTRDSSPAQSDSSSGTKTSSSSESSSRTSHSSTNDSRASSGSERKTESTVYYL